MSKELVLLFPGQGVQRVGMCKTLLESEVAKEILIKADRILGYSVKDKIMNSSSDELEQTDLAQPLIYVCSMIAFEKMRKEHKEWFDSFATYIYAGLSLGEYTALVASGKCSFEDGLELVRDRGLFMKEAASKNEKTSMTTVTGLDESMVKNICGEWNNLRSTDSQQKIYIANYLFPKCVVVSGHTDGLEFLESKAQAAKALKVARNRVGGAFHTKYMEDAQEKLQQRLEEIELIQNDAMLFSNVTAQLHMNETIKQGLSDQLILPVKWEQTLKNIYNASKEQSFIDIGPGDTMIAMLRRGVNMKVGNQCNKLTKEKIGTKE